MQKIKKKLQKVGARRTCEIAATLATFVCGCGGMPSEGTNASLATDNVEASEHALGSTDGLDDSVLFDAEYYSSQYVDLQNAFHGNQAALRSHWLNNGIKEGRRASPVFDIRIYLWLYSDISAAFGTDYPAAMRHFLVQGLPVEGRRGSVEFNAAFYLSRNADVANAFGATNYLAAARHFMGPGLWSQGRAGSNEFDVNYYLCHDSDLTTAFGTNRRAAIQHFGAIGLPKEGRRGSSAFDVKYYLSRYADLKRAYGSNYWAAITQWLYYGIPEGRSGDPGDAGGTNACATASPLGPKATLVSGTKKILYLRCQYKGPRTPAEELNPQFSDTNLAQTTTLVDQFYKANSWSLLRFAPVKAGGSVVSPIYTLPYTEAEYAQGKPSLYGACYDLGRNGGYDYTKFDFVMICYHGTNGTLGADAEPSDARWIHLRGDGSVTTIIHELRHQIMAYGAGGALSWENGGWEANAWQSNNGSPIDPNGTPILNGDYLNVGGDARAAGTYTLKHLSALDKHSVGWVQDAHLRAVNTNKDTIQTVRIYALDDGGTSWGFPRAVVVPRYNLGPVAGAQIYWAEFRSLYNIPSLANGLVLHWAPWAATMKGHLLDMRPNMVNAANNHEWQDVGLMVGRTFRDTQAGIGITPVAVNNTSPKSIDVVIASGAFASNRSPLPNITTPGQTTRVFKVGQTVTFNANANDADGDALAYYWNFGDNSDASRNSPTVSHAWVAPGTYYVTVDVSDYMWAGPMSMVEVTIVP